MGAYATVLFVLGMTGRLAELADVRSDALGLLLDEERLPKRIRSKSRRTQPPKSAGSRIMDRAILVSADLAARRSRGTPVARTRKGTETATFEYDHRWLGSRDAFSLEPALTLGRGRTTRPPARRCLRDWDSAPDRWGRLLMRRGNAAGRRGSSVRRAR